MAGIVMAIVGFIALVFSVISLFEELSLDRYPPMFGNSWIVIMALFWFFSGIALIIAFGKEDKRTIK
ncbi:MAG: hypothetical protein WBA23_02230 [Tunicatimonas sp.]|uniref:hypothetical protein n=1 Tax=Tunicatimonas sp. TaxID=1940096 RepID=UPI003C76513F